MQLLKITNVPMEYRFEMEPAHLEMKQAPAPRQQVRRDPPQLNIRSRNIQVRLDTTDMRASLNLRSTGAFLGVAAGQGRQAAYQAAGEAVQFGNQMAQIDDGVSIAQLVQQKLLQQPTTFTTFLPSAGPAIGWEPAELDMDYNPGSMEIDWHVLRNMMDYVPGKFSMNILQYPKVQIEYLGEPSYVPPSASPNYEEESA